MTDKVLHTADKLLFVKQLYDYCNRLTNTRVVTLAAEKVGVKERALREKMLFNRPFKGQELDVIEKLYLNELGQETFDQQMSIFVTKMSDGDFRTIDKHQAAEVQELVGQNEDLEAAQLFGLTK